MVVSVLPARMLARRPDPPVLCGFDLHCGGLACASAVVHIGYDVLPTARAPLGGVVCVCNRLMLSHVGLGLV